MEKLQKSYSGRKMIVAISDPSTTDYGLIVFGELLYDDEKNYYILSNDRGIAGMECGIPHNYKYSWAIGDGSVRQFEIFCVQYFFFIKNEFICET